MARRRLEELSILNVLFCLLVVMIHVLAQPASALDPDGWKYTVLHVVQQMAFVSVYGFFFLSGLKLTLPRENEPRLGRYYLDRVRKLLLPYLLAAVICYITFLCLGWYEFSVTGFLRDIALGAISAQFYFIIALFQFIALAPLFRFLSRRYSPVLLLPAALIITLISPMFLNSIAGLITPNVGVSYSDRVFTSYLIYYLAGCCAGQHYPRFLDMLEKNRSLVTFSALFWGAADAVVSALGFARVYRAPYLDLVHTLYLISAIPFLLDRARMYKGLIRGAPARLLRATDRASYLIYLYHCLFIALFNCYAPGIVGEDQILPLLVLRILLVYPISIGGSILWQHLWAAVKGRVRQYREKPK